MPSGLKIFSRMNLPISCFVTLETRAPVHSMLAPYNYPSPGSKRRGVVNALGREWALLNPGW